MRSVGKYDKYYKTSRRKRLREAVLMRDGYMCQDSKRYGKSIEANTVHHIFPADKYPKLFFNPYNLISLSTEAHNRMHDRFTNEISQYGKNLQERFRKKVFEYEEGEWL